MNKSGLTNMWKGFPSPLMEINIMIRLYEENKFRIYTFFGHREVLK